MKQVLLNIPNLIYTSLWSHLLLDHSPDEEAAFLYVRRETSDKSEIFHYLDWLLVPDNGFIIRSPYHFELTEQMRATVIKKAHDLDASIVELHSHKGSRWAEFSESDLFGFQEFVPHVWWRLKGRPYIAVVVSHTSFDGLVWLTNPNIPQRLDGIVTENSFLRPTKLTFIKEAR